MIFLGLFIAIILAFFIAPLASQHPDGLERVAQDKGFIEKAQMKPVFKSPIADYIFPGIENEKLATALSGALGTLVVFGVSFGIAVLLRKKT